MCRYNDLNREVAAELGAAFVDLERSVPPRWDYFDTEQRYDLIHMSAAACVLAAQAIHEVVLPLIPERPPDTGGRASGGARQDGTAGTGVPHVQP